MSNRLGHTLRKKCGLMKTMQWQCLEAIPGLSAVPSVWRRYLAEDFELFKAAFLQAKPVLVKSFPCD